MRTTLFVLVFAAVVTACQRDHQSGDLLGSETVPTVTAGSGTAMAQAPEIRHLCPESADVSLDQLALGTDTTLLVEPPSRDWDWDEDRLGLYEISRGTLIPMPVDLLTLKNEVNGLAVAVSPNRQWLLIPRKSTTTGRVTQWISSSDGREQWPVISDRDADIGKWVDDRTVVVGRFVEERHNPYFFEFLRLVDPFTGESREFNDLPGLYAPGLGWLVFRYQDRAYLLYLTEDGYGLRDLDSGQNGQMLTGVPVTDPAAHERGIQVRPDGTLEVRIARPEGVAISLPVAPPDLVGLAVEDLTLSSLELPAPVHASNWGIRRTAPYGEPLYGEGGSFWWYDAGANELRDYCVDDHSAAFISGDGRFAAVVRMYLPGPNPIHATLWLLDLATGQRARLEDLYPVAWVQARP